jgi:hypothetical protein
MGFYIPWQYGAGGHTLTWVVMVLTLKKNCISSEEMQCLSQLDHIFTPPK